MVEPHGFAYAVRSDGSVLITHRGVQAGVLRGRRAEGFLADVISPDGAAAPDQQLMAGMTGNYRRGNERTAREHPRNRR